MKKTCLCLIFLLLFLMTGCMNAEAQTIAEYAEMFQIPLSGGKCLLFEENYSWLGDGDLVIQIELSGEENEKALNWVERNSRWVKGGMTADQIETLFGLEDGETVREGFGLLDQRIPYDEEAWFSIYQQKLERFSMVGHPTDHFLYIQYTPDNGMVYIHQYDA